MVGAADGFRGKLILTVSFLGRPFPESSSSSGPRPIAVRRGGAGGGIEPAGFGSGFGLSFFLSWSPPNGSAQRPGATGAEQDLESSPPGSLRRDRWAKDQSWRMLLKRVPLAARLELWLEDLIASDVHRNIIFCVKEARWWKCSHGFRSGHASGNGGSESPAWQPTVLPDSQAWCARARSSLTADRFIRPSN